MPSTLGLEGPRMGIPPSCSTCRSGGEVRGIDNRWLGPQLSTKRSRRMPQFFGLRGLGTPANDIAIQLPALIAGNEWEAISSLLAGLSPEELQAVSDRAIALYDVPPETMTAIISTLGKTEVIEVTGKAPAIIRLVPRWVWAALALGGIATGFAIYQRRSR